MPAERRGGAELLLERLRPAAPAVLLSALLGLLPFDTCLLQRFAGMPCPGCGFTRATLCLLRGEFAASLRLHPGALLGVPLVLAAIVLAATLPPEHPAWARFQARALAFAGTALVAIWLLRIVRVLPWP
jgi:hypothetical protein